MRGLAVAALLFVSPALGAGPSLTQLAEARSLYDAGVKLYNVGEYDQAIDHFKRAYLLSTGPELLFNIAQAYRENGPGSCREAVKFYRSYLRELPAARDRTTVEGRIAGLHACAEAEAEATPARLPPAPPPAVEVERSGARRKVGIALGAAGLVAGGLGGFFSWQGAELSRAQSRGYSPAVDSQGRLANVVAISGLAAGALLLGTGAVLALTGGSEPISASAEVTPLGARLTVNGAF